MTNIRLFLLSLLMTFLSFSAFSQEIITAERYLEMVSEKYANMRDFEAKIAIQSSGSNMTGTMSYLVPYFLRIDFTTPAEQVIVFTGDMLTLYIPDYRATLTQEASSGRASAAGEGLRTLRRNYTPSYVTGPAPVLLEGTAESVVKLRLTRRAGSESFREIILSINPDTKLIRRMDGTTLAGALVRFDFSAIKINQGIPEQRFIYDSPATSNMYHNFLYRDTD